jgi:uncharacterized 2Fe-2S/4Fe-4S cluster protein (DUF4445 family)
MRKTKKMKNQVMVRPKRIIKWTMLTISSSMELAQMVLDAQINSIKIWRKVILKVGLQRKMGKQVMDLRIVVRVKGEDRRMIGTKTWDRTKIIKMKKEGKHMMAGMTVRVEGAVVVDQVVELEQSKVEGVVVDMETEISREEVDHPWGHEMIMHKEEMRELASKIEEEVEAVVDVDVEEIGVAQFNSMVLNIQVS